MRSDAIDQLLSNYLKMPARVSWKGAIGDSVRGVFEEGRLELSGFSILALPCDRIVVESDRFQFTPGMPARIEVDTGPLERGVGVRGAVVVVDRVCVWLDAGHDHLPLFTVRTVEVVAHHACPAVLELASVVRVVDDVPAGKGEDVADSKSSK